MRSFNYIKVTTVDEAASLLKQDRSSVIAGGTDMLGRLKTMISANLPQLLVDITPINSLYKLSK